MSLIGRHLFCRGAPSCLWWGRRPVPGAGVGRAGAGSLGSAQAVLFQGWNSNVERAQQSGWAGQLLWTHCWLFRLQGKDMAGPKPAAEFNMYSAEWLGWHNNIILQCPADLLQILLACWLPLILVPCECRGAVWETAGKISYPLLAKHCPKQQGHAGVSIPAKTLSSNFYQICFVAWIDFFF